MTFWHDGQDIKFVFVSIKVHSRGLNESNKKKEIQSILFITADLLLLNRLFFYTTLLNSLYVSSRSV